MAQPHEGCEDSGVSQADHPRPLSGESATLSSMLSSLVALSRRSEQSALAAPCVGRQLDDAAHRPALVDLDKDIAEVVVDGQLEAAARFDECVGDGEAGCAGARTREEPVAPILST